MTDFNFITNTCMVNSVMATNQVPRKHSNMEIVHIRQTLHENLSNSELPKALIQPYLAMLMRYETAFSANSMDVGQTDILKHKIDIKDKKEPAHRQQFRLAADHLQLIKDNIVWWMKAGILEKYNSKYNSCLLYTSPSPRDRG